MHRFEMYSESLRSAAEQSGNSGDLATQDIYIEAIRDVDKQAWFLKSHLS